ncbi:F-box protein SKIP19-like [Juglans microcarpa x Juglans regia]|uniref:F-box protein SKIP19-like n=1 Tax=Juglans microcarpa x Juglans regia TaxID=2249226 RepID=UPI001B7E539F|nr:F-box protein SKIP19-like [Juglans microcarpa x Juglans regia]
MDPPPAPPPPQPPGQCRNWLELPRDVTESILLRLGAIEILTSAQKVCLLWRNICKDPSMWRAVDMRNPGDFWDMPYDLETMCRHAVDRSCGQLVDINVEYFGTDELLNYIADCSSRLRRLQLVSCHSISEEGLSEVAAKLPLLEELNISYCSYWSLTKEPLEVVGRCCPLLKSLKLNSKGHRRPYIECDEEALAIAENMPELRQLQLFGNKLTNDGLLAILDGCPHLESLDLRQCFNVNLTENLGRRCAEQIKHLRFPTDPTDDAEIHDNGSSDEDYPSGFSDIDNFSDDYGYYEFSGDSDYSYYGDIIDYGDFYFD